MALSKGMLKHFQEMIAKKEEDTPLLKITLSDNRDNIFGILREIDEEAGLFILEKTRKKNKNQDSYVLEKTGKAFLKLETVEEWEEVRLSDIPGGSIMF